MNTPPHYGTVQIDGVPRPALIFPLTLDGIRRKNLGLAIWFVPLVAFAVIYLILLIRIGTYTDATSNILRIFVLAMEGLFIAIGVWLIRTFRKPGFGTLLRGVTRCFGHRPNARSVGDDHQSRHAQARGGSQSWSLYEHDPASRSLLDES